MAVYTVTPTDFVMALCEMSSFIADDVKTQLLGLQSSVTEASDWTRVPKILKLLFDTPPPPPATAFQWQSFQS